MASSRGGDSGVGGESNDEEEWVSDTEVRGYYMCIKNLTTCDFYLFISSNLNSRLNFFIRLGRINKLFDSGFYLEQSNQKGKYLHKS